MSLTKLQLSFASAVVVTGAGIYAVQEHDNAALRDELTALQTAPTVTATPHRTDAATSPVSEPLAALQVSDEELVRLRDEAVALQQQLQTAAQPKPLAASRKTGGEAFSMKELDSPPKARTRKAPVYPAELRAAGIEGSVVVSMLIDTTGRVVQTRVEKSTHQGFEFAALQAVQEWQFEPGRKGGRQVNTRVSQVLQFSVGKDSPVASDWF